jgi:protease I
MRSEPRVLILAADEFEEMELLYPLYRLREEQLNVTIASLAGRPVTGKKGHGPVEVDAATDDVHAEDYDALVIPGGYAPDKLRRDDHVPRPGAELRWRRQARRLHLPRGMGADIGGILKGRPATSVGAIRDDMVNAGVDWVDEATVVDGNLISARTPADLGPWMRALLGALHGA